MKTVFRFFKRAAKKYFEAAANNYAWMYTGCVYYPIYKKEEKDKEEGKEA